MKVILTSARGLSSKLSTSLSYIPCVCMVCFKHVFFPRYSSTAQKVDHFLATFVEQILNGKLHFLCNGETTSS